MFEKMKSKANSIVIPPMFIWGTLLSTNACIARTSIRSNVSYGTHKVALKVDNIKENCKTKIDEKRAERAEKKKEETKNEETEKETVVENKTEEVKENEENNNETTIDMGVTYETEEPVQYGPDFSDLVEPTVEMKIEVESTAEELKPVTQDDINEALKQMRKSSVKIKGEE